MTKKGAPFLYAIYNMYEIVRDLQHENGTFLYAIYNQALFLLEVPQSSIIPAENCPCCKRSFGTDIDYRKNDSVSQFGVYWFYWGPTAGALVFVVCRCHCKPEARRRMLLPHWA